MACAPCIQTRYGLVSTTTSLLRPLLGELYAGKLIYETDTKRLMLYNGSAWIIECQPWTNWTPEIDAGTLDIAKTVSYARYCIASGVVTATAQLNITGAGIVNSIIECTVPVTMSAAYGGGYVMALGSGCFTDAAVAQYNLVASAATGVLRFVRTDQGYNNWFGQDPVILVSNGDWLTFTVSYETT